MKVFHTPVIDGIYRDDLKVRMPDQPDAEAYERVSRAGQEALDDLDRDGYVKVIHRNVDNMAVGYHTYQQDDL